MMNLLQNHLSEKHYSYIKYWLANHHCRIKLTPHRRSKLGDYKRLTEKTHLITINQNLEQNLFFFVLTHEIAHLLAFNEKRNIAPHGKEWKKLFGRMILESLSVYPDDLQKILIIFAKNPKANFMSSPELVKYFDKKTDENHIYVEELEVGTHFIYQSSTYEVEEKKKKRYLCKNLQTGRRYLFKSCARVQKLD